MTKVLFNGSIQGFRGRLGNMIFRQLPDGTTVVTGAPPKKTRRQKKRAKLKRSARQQAHNSRFQETITYAKVAQMQPVYAELTAVTPMQTAYNFALSNWLHAPEIHCIKRGEGCILVQASDNIMVTRVKVTLLDDEGSVLEMGEAVRGQGDWWEYMTKADRAAVAAEAWDLAENVAKGTL